MIGDTTPARGRQEIVERRVRAREPRGAVIAPIARALVRPAAP
jgi:hypothetical protein